MATTNKVGVALVAGAGITATIAALIAARKAKAATNEEDTGVVTLDDVSLQALAAIAESVDSNTAKLNQLLTQLPGMLKFPSQVGIVPNVSTINVIVMALPQANTSVKLPDMAIPDTMALVIKAWPTNVPGSLVFVTSNQQQTPPPSSIYPLMPNESIAYKIQNAKILYASTDTPGSGLVLTVEQG